MSSSAGTDVRTALDHDRRRGDGAGGDYAADGTADPATPVADGGQYVSTDDSPKSALTTLFGTAETSLPVVEGDGVVGVVSEHHVRSYFDSERGP